MTTTTQTPMTSAAMQSLDPDAVRALTSLKAACKACEDADNSQAKKGAEEAGDKYDGACQDDAKRRFLAQGKAIVDDMWATFNTLQDGYQSSLRPHENVGPRLHQVFTDTWVVVGQKIAPIASDVQTRGQQDHWTGAGTDTSDHYFQRCAWAANTLSQCVDWFTNNLMTGTGTWQGALDDHIQQMTSTSVTNAAVLTGDSWPKATKTTDTSKLPTGTDPKYTVPSAVGSVGTEGPITDRGDSSGVSVDDAAPQSPGGYA